ncbi:hypothetical protein GPECTOR_31g306 [Gonium pectorale]|uniref:Lipoamide acyltransferase component of branched-chain alpha-keto acid dehydrogenase complex, mitochondrial n=1 Tax=Gonium pectorale TaxID=33097 RepID=A0A150GDM7_GONPE|nr:hypothetical protein GPECTOR_31g306 [Gonium pectorale]|eukprot:KXZ47944.1 hypothetical protein GPECTOR_31g306 [Gonium pectorale]
MFAVMQRFDLITAARRGMPGDVVSPFEKLCDVQSDKASIEITSRYGGRVVTLHHTVGAMVKVGAPLVDLEVPDQEQVAPEHLAAAAAAAVEPLVAAAARAPVVDPAVESPGGSVGVAVAVAPAGPSVVVAATNLPGGDAAATATATIAAPLSTHGAAAPLPMAPPSRIPAALPAAGEDAGGAHIGNGGGGGGGGGGVHATPAVRALAKWVLRRRRRGEGVRG